MVVQRAIRLERHAGQNRHPSLQYFLLVSLYADLSWTPKCALPRDLEIVAGPTGLQVNAAQVMSSSLQRAVEVLGALSISGLESPAYYSATGVHLPPLAAPSLRNQSRKRLRVDTTVGEAPRSHSRQPKAKEQRGGKKEKKKKEALSRTEKRKKSKETEELEENEESDEEETVSPKKKEKKTRDDFDAYTRISGNATVKEAEDRVFDRAMAVLTAVLKSK